jgi:hypothetical protein
MLKKIVIAVFVGGLLSPVGLAFSHTGGKGLAPRGQVHVSTSRSTVTKYRTTSRPYLTTKTVNHTTTSTKKTTYTSTHNGGNVTRTRTVTQTGTILFIDDVYTSTDTERTTVGSVTVTETIPLTSEEFAPPTTTTVTETVTTTAPAQVTCASASC